MVDSRSEAVQAMLAGSAVINQMRVQIDSVVGILAGFAQLPRLFSGVGYENVVPMFYVGNVGWSIGRVGHTISIDACGPDQVLYSYQRRTASSIPSRWVEPIWLSLPELQRVMMERCDGVREGVEWLWRVAAADEEARQAAANRPNYG